MIEKDQRALELGNFEIAASEKKRLEEKQRVTRKEYESLNKNWEPLWFK